MTSDVSVDVFQRKKPKPLVSEILRPQALSDLTLPMPTIHRLQRVIESGSKVNMLFYGPPGSGKTSTARIFMNAIGGAMTINRSSETSPDLAKCIKDFLSRVGANICFVDEAHFISKRDQTVLVDTYRLVFRQAPFPFRSNRYHEANTRNPLEIDGNLFRGPPRGSRGSSKAIDGTLREYAIGKRIHVRQGALRADYRSQLPRSTLNRQ